MPTDLQIDPLTSQEVDFLLGRLGVCENCGSVEGVELEAGRTQYAYAGEEETAEDPNRSAAYCRPCAALHHEHWDAMWEEYHASRG